MKTTNRPLELFSRPGTLVGMVHVGALPGTPAHAAPLGELVEQALADAAALAEAGFEALLVENMHDRPYLRGAVGPEITTAMTRVVLAVRQAHPDLPLGVQILAGANEAALAVALAAGADFIRAEGFVFGAVADEGLLAEAAAGPLLRYRRAIGAEGVAILADVKKKHSSHALTADVSLAETVRAAAFCGADALVVTGVATGEPTALADLREAAGATELPVLVGSGVTPEQIPELLPTAAGLIVGSYIKENGRWDGPVDPERARRLVEAVHAAR